MKAFHVVKKSALIFALFLPSACATKLSFVPVDTVKHEQIIEITNIEDYEILVKQKGVKTVYYTKEFFYIEINSVLYLLRSRGYKNFRTYKEGKLDTPEEYSIFKPGYSLKRPYGR